jgi:dinuclear metal center YbgI/SA1388 family protein
MHVQEFIAGIEEEFPQDLAEDFDKGRIGLVVEGKPEFTTVCCALDATTAVIREAAAAGAGMLVVHHTPLWTPVTSITGQTAEVLRVLLASGMNLYVMHTNFDHAAGGVNDALADILSLHDRTHLSLGIVGTCTVGFHEISACLGCSLRIWGEPHTVHRLAVVGGSGFVPDLMREAEEASADAFLSSEMKHSVARSAPFLCIEATHYALEAPAMRRLADRKDWQYIDDPPLQFPVP